MSPAVAGGVFSTESSENAEVQGQAVEHTACYRWWMGLLYRNLMGISGEGAEFSWGQHCSCSRSRWPGRRLSWGVSAAVSHYSSFCISSVAQSCPALCDPWTAARQASLSISSSRSLLKLMSIALVMPFFEIGIVGGVCDFLSSVLLQQKFEAMDGPVLKLSFIGKQRKIPPGGVRAGCEEKRTPWLNLAPLFVCFSPPLEPSLHKLG